MMDFVKKVMKPLATGAAILIGVGAATLFSDPKSWKDIFQHYDDPPVGPWRDKEFFDSADRDENGAIILHADELKQLRWMSTSQLKAIFRGNRKFFRVENSPAAYQELRWMSTSQLEAIFGSKDI